MNYLHKQLKFTTMTKIYLVKFTYFDKMNGLQEETFQAFTNYKKAKIYCEYKNLQIKKKKSIWYHCNEGEFVVETMTISQWDWSKELNELQIKDLPY